MYFHGVFTCIYLHIVVFLRYNLEPQDAALLRGHAPHGDECAVVGGEGLLQRLQRGGADAGSTAGLRKDNRAKKTRNYAKSEFPLMVGFWILLCIYPIWYIGLDL